MRLRDGRTVVAVGGRLDRITTETVDTPLKTNFTPSESTFTVFNPSVGLKHELVKGLRAHFAVGRAFIPAEAIDADRLHDDDRRRAHADHAGQSRPRSRSAARRSTSAPSGRRATTRFDVTVFRTVVKDRFISNVVVSNPPPPDPIVVSVANGLDAHISGLELEAEQRVGGRVGVFANATHYFKRKERLDERRGAGHPQRRAEHGARRRRRRLRAPQRARVSGRYVQGRKDNDFNAPGFPIVDYDNFTVVDASAIYRLVRQHAVVVAINNVFDAFYYEKMGYPAAGRVVQAVVSGGLLTAATDSTDRAQCHGRHRTTRRCKETTT